jgi:methyl-accepting chemotaxis protein
MQVLGVKEAESLIGLANDMDDNTVEIAHNLKTFSDINIKLEEIESALSQSEVASQQTLTAADLSLSNAEESRVAAEHIQNISQTMAENVSELIEIAALLKDD